MKTDTRTAKHVFKVRVDSYAERARKPVTEWFLVEAATREEAVIAATTEAEAKADVSKRWRLFQWREAHRANFPMRIFPR